MLEESLVSSVPFLCLIIVPGSLFGELSFSSFLPVN